MIDFKKVDPAPIYFGGLLSVITILMLSPSKDVWVARVIMVLLPICVVAYLNFRVMLSKKSKQYIALTMLWLIYIASTEYLLGRGVDYHMIKYGALGLAVFFVVQVALKRININDKHLLVSVLLLPACVHFIYMWFDIAAYITHTSLNEFVMSDLKDVPRVGRRYLSNALVGGVVGSVFLSLISSSRKILWRFWAIAFLLSLLVLDARGAYVSMIMAALIVIFIAEKRIIKDILRALKKYWPALIIFVISVLSIGYVAGTDRWMNFSRSVENAWQDTIHKTESYPPYIDKIFWGDVKDIEKCLIERQKRCWVDQSAYLRFAWTIEGVLSLSKKPFGVGGGDRYMGRYWGVEGDANKWQRVDSGMTEYFVTYGIVSVAYLACLFGLFFKSLFDAQRLSKIALAFSLPIVILANRMIFDLVTEGVWLYFSTLFAVHFYLIEKE